MSKVTLMFPTKDFEPSVGERFEHMAMFAARRSRTLLEHDDLWAEVTGWSTEKQDNFLEQVIHQEWATNIAEFNLFMFDIEHVPSWLMIELARHRFLIRDWSFNQRSKRAVPGFRIPVLNPFDAAGPEAELHADFEFLAETSRNLMEKANRLRVRPEKMRYASLEGSETAFVAAGNATALHHIFKLRGGARIGADDKAAPELIEVAESMYDQVRDFCPRIFRQVLGT